MKLALTALLIFALVGSLVAGLQAVEVVEANFLPHEIPSPPPIIITSPLNITYSQNDVLLNFTIVGISNWWEPAYHLTNLYYEVDGNSINIPIDNFTNIEQHSALIVGLAKGEHNLTVHANASGVYRNNYPNSGTTIYSVESTQIVSFTVDKELKNTSSPLDSPSLTPTISPTQILTPTLTSTLSPTSSPTQQPPLSPSPSARVDVAGYNSQLPYLVGISLIAIGLTSLLSYFKKRKR